MGKQSTAAWAAKQKPKKTTILSFFKPSSSAR